MLLSAHQNQAVQGSLCVLCVDYLLIKRQHNIPDCEVWSCTGTPVDCVKIALDQILKDRKPDLILGGINHGDNSSVNNHYSGTMGIAYEAV